MKKMIPVTQSSMPDIEEYINEIKDLWESKWLTNVGIKHSQLESLLMDYLKVPNISLFTNGHSALEYILEAFELTGEIITTPFTFASTTHAIVRNGLKPVFCDINKIDYTIDANKIESLITDQTSAILPVHVYGNICDVAVIDKIAKKNNLKVIYDAAHAFGVLVNGHGIGNYGDASMFSFHATKVFHTVEGGAITCNNSNVKKTLDILKNFGITGPDIIDYIGGNAKMNEFQAAMGICNIRHIDQEIEKRKFIVERYIHNLQGIPGIQLSQNQIGVIGNYSYFPVLFEGYKKSRNEVYEELKINNISGRKYFYPTTNSFQCYNMSYNVDNTPVAKYISERVLTLPLFSNLALDDVDRICEVIIK